MTRKLTRDGYLALGWVYGQCCAMLDRGQDPRKASMPDLIARAEASIGEELTCDWSVFVRDREAWWRPSCVDNPDIAYASPYDKCPECGKPVKIWES